MLDSVVVIDRVTADTPPKVEHFYAATEFTERIVQLRGDLMDQDVALTMKVAECRRQEDRNRCQACPY